MSAMSAIGMPTARSDGHERSACLSLRVASSGWSCQGLWVIRGRSGSDYRATHLHRSCPSANSLAPVATRVHSTRSSRSATWSILSCMCASGEESSRLLWLLTGDNGDVKSTRHVRLHVIVVLRRQCRSNVGWSEAVRPGQEASDEDAGGRRASTCIAHKAPLSCPPDCRRLRKRHQKRNHNPYSHGCP